MAISRSFLYAVGVIVPALAAGVMLPKQVGLELLSLLLTFIAGVYAGFALLDARKREFAIELFGVLVIFALAAAALWASPVYLAAGYIFHGVWDALHHPKGIQTVIPRGYAPFCLIVDVPIGVFIFFWW
jgi:hypothetical protein